MGKMTEKQWRKTIGLRIRTARRMLDITQADLAKEIGSVSAGFICEIEKGRKQISAYSLYLLEKKLNSLWIEGLDE
jgi:transcriptional regulator with XRE-family HTH domain